MKIEFTRGLLVGEFHACRDSSVLPSTLPFAEGRSDARQQFLGLHSSSAVISLIILIALYSSGKERWVQSNLNVCHGSDGCDSRIGSLLQGIRDVIVHGRDGFLKII